jgi:DNA-directed RNA polymerase II subunit RPB9
VNNRLMFICRTCHVGEPATSPCVYQNKLNNQVGDTAGVTQDVGSDPTVGFPRFYICQSSCGCPRTGEL